ncbi:nitroreductase family protein [Anaeroselena agilis]|uniref:Nitroreductase n=1 Tax=Anaeroselena agilis TaxID=3063788 RepID=A0ABU3NYP3_9FIRM|nr:nitroreductase [Selenomonadales bacterium 4137-cl]
MNLTEAIANRRSVRSYTAQKVDKDAIDKLLHAAVQAPSASNTQPWSFVVIQDAALLKEYSDRSKSLLLSMIDLENSPHKKYRDMLSNPAFNIFYTAGTLIAIYAKPMGRHSYGDCCLSAQNLMLAAHGLGLGTCWIGFAGTLLDTPAMKEELRVPVEYSLVAPIIVGYPQGRIPQLTHDNPEILFWKE